MNGLVCVQVFFIRQGKVIEREVSIFDGIDDVEEAVLDVYRTLLPKS